MPEVTRPIDRTELLTNKMLRAVGVMRSLVIGRSRESAKLTRSPVQPSALMLRAFYLRNFVLRTAQRREPERTL
jgi:hypothetical protein